MKILIVDDSNFSRKINAKMLRKFLDNIEITFASDGVEGFELYKKINPEYIFVDLLMPKVNGTNLIKAIKEHNKDAKIIVISADVQKNVREEVEEYNIIAFINKPFNEEKAEEICNLIKGEYYE